MPKDAAKEHAGPGRPQKRFIPWIADNILQRWMFSAYSLERVIEEYRQTNAKCPSLRVFWTWVNENKEFSHAYARAREFRAHYLADKSLDEALTPRKGVYSKKSSKNGEVTVEVREDDNVARSRLIAEIMMKRASQLFPKEYRESRRDDHGESGSNEQLEALHHALMAGPVPPDEESEPEKKPPPPGDDEPKK